MYIYVYDYAYKYIYSCIHKYLPRQSHPSSSPSSRTLLVRGISPVALLPRAASLLAPLSPLSHLFPLSPLSSLSPLSLPSLPSLSPLPAICPKTRHTRQILSHAPPSVRPPTLDHQSPKPRNPTSPSSGEGSQKLSGEPSAQRCQDLLPAGVPRS